MVRKSWFKDFEFLFFPPKKENGRKKVESPRVAVTVYIVENVHTTAYFFISIVQTVSNIFFFSKKFIYKIFFAQKRKKNPLIKKVLQLK